MNNPSQDFLVQAWKQQLDTGLRVVETLIEGSMKMREAQLEAAAEAHADAVATHKAMSGSSDVQQLLRLQSQWASANANRCLTYWRHMYDAAAQTGADLAKCAQRPSP